MDNQMIHIGICGDEPIIASVVKEKCESIMKSIEVPYRISCFTDGLSLLEYTENLDLIFLDIEMPTMNGFEVAKRLKKKTKHCAIIILTNHERFMQQGYMVSAFRYLTKPISEIDCREALISFIEERKDNKCIILNIDGETHYLYERDILYIESLGEGSLVITNNNKFTCNYKMKEWIPILSNDSFSLSQRSYIIHLKYVTSIAKTHVVLENNIKVPVARRKYKELKNKFHQYIKDHSYHLGGI